MADEDTTTEEVTTEPGAPEEETTEEVESTDDAQNDDEQSDDKLPEWARNKLTKANTEAAKYRTQLRETEAKLAEAKTAEEFEAVRNEFTQQIQELTRAKVAAEHGLPDALAARLRGDTEEELIADAKVLAELLPKKSAKPAPTGTPKGGLDPEDDDDENLSPAELVKRYSRARPRF